MERLEQIDLDCIYRAVEYDRKGLFMGQQQQQFFENCFIPNHSHNTHKERERERERERFCPRARTNSLSPREGYAKKKKMTTTTSAEEEEEEEEKNAFQKDGIIERKKEQMLNKLNAMHDERAQKRAMVRGQKERDLDPNESLERFAREFKRMVEDIERDLLAVREDDDTGDEKKRKKKEKSLTKIADLREKVAKSAYFLPKFDAEKSMKTCDGLEKKARADDDARGGGSKEDAASTTTTKKKFSFSAKMKATKTNDGVAAAGKGVEEASSSAAAIERLQKKHRETNSLLVVRENKEGETIVLTSEECEGRDVTLERLTRCEVTIESCANRKPRSVRMRNLVECEIKATDIDGSAYVENMSDTIAFIGSRQLRVHDATKCQFYCRVASGPIIERCKAVEFAPLSSSSENGGVEKQEENLWNKVEDFGWIKQEQSPNWSVIEEKNRVAFKVR
jgi:hypothetical protein